MNITKRLTDIKENIESIAAIGNICFIGYYGIMVILKTFGYVSYEMFYKLAFLLALGLLAVKVLTTKYTMREFFILYLLLAVSAVCWIRVGEKNITLITLTLWGMKGVDFYDLIKYTFGIRIVGTLLMILLACVGVMDIEATSAMATDYSLRSVYALGYNKTNTTFYIIFLILVLAVYLNYERLNFWYFLVTTTLCYIGFCATYCRTGMYAFLGMWVLILVDKLWKKKTYYRLICYQTPILTVISIAAMIFYQHSSALWFKINRIFNGRIEIANNYHKAFGITLFPKTAQIFWDMNITTMDNFYMYFFVSCGLLVTVGYLYLATRAQQHLYERRKTVEILFFTIFAVYAMLEQSPFNPVLNPFILLVGELVYKDFRVRDASRNDCGYSVYGSDAEMKIAEQNVQDGNGA